MPRTCHSGGVRWFKKQQRRTAHTETTTVAVPTTDRVIGHGDDTFDVALSRGAQLRQLADARVSVPERVVKRPGESVVVSMPHVEGVSVETLIAQRGYLSVPECVYLGVNMCGALAAMHASGLAHGAVSGANVLVSNQGIVLIDTMAPGVTGATTVSAQDNGAGPSPAADVSAVGELLAACVAPSMRQGFMGWVDPMIDPVPSARPSARAVEAGLPQCATPTPIRIVQTSVTQGASVQARQAPERTMVLRASRPWRLRRAGLRIGLVVGTAALLAVVAFSILPRVDTAIAEEGSGGGPTTKSEAAAHQATAHQAAENHTAATVSATEAARELTQARFAALEAGDGEKLLAGVVPGSDLAGQVGEQAKELAAGTVRFEGVSVAAVSAKQLRGVVTDHSDGLTHAVVAVTYDVGAHVVWYRGERSHVSAHGESVQLELRLDGTTWLVERVLPQSSPK